MKWSESCSVVSTLCNSMDYAIRGILQARIPEWVAIPFSRGSSNPGMEPRSPTLPADSLPDEPSENTEVGCHFLLQVTFLTQGSNSSLLCLLHWRQILYHWATGETAKYKTGKKKKAPISPRWHSCQAVSCVQLWEFFLGRLPAAELLWVSVYVLLELGQP